MKLHSDTLTVDDVRDAMLKAKERGGVDRLVVFNTLSARGSRSRKNGIEIRLEWVGTKVKGDGRRKTNSGSYGSGDDYAAFYAEWGWFLAEVFDMDPDAKLDRYEGRDSFHQLTRHAFHYAAV
jgi:hypothetical protein